MRWFFGSIGAAAGALGVAFGAFGAHVLRDRLDAQALALWQTATQYLMWHALALVLVALSAARRTAPTAARVAAIGYLAGSVLFCGSLYALALGAPRWCGAITPFGGVAWLVAWGAFALALARSDAS